MWSHKFDLVKNLIQGKRTVKPYVVAQCTLEENPIDALAIGYDCHAGRYAFRGDGPYDSRTSSELGLVDPR